jgi:PucR C-terminal helix-turn-helix domain/GGDEF-like domain
MSGIGGTGSSKGSSRGAQDQRSRLAELLRARAPEIQQAILDRLDSLNGNTPVREPDYLHGLSEAVRKGVEYGIEVVAVGAERAAPAPLALPTQVRLAARHRISLALVIRRFTVAKGSFQEFVLEEAAAMPDLAPAQLTEALNAQECVLQQLLAAATEEHQRETSPPASTREARIAERVRRLLAGEQVDASLLEYDLAGHHLGLVARSPDAHPLLRQLSAAVDGRLLAVAPNEAETWAWIGARRPIDVDAVLRWAKDAWPAATPLGIGEPAAGPSGWRRTHRQADAAATLDRSGSGAALRYRDVALLAAAAKDPLMVSSLREMYLAPLAGKGHRDVPLRETLRAYFAADGNASSACSALGVSRQTVANRLQTVEERLQLPLTECADALQVALRLEELGHFSDLPDSRS